MMCDGKCRIPDSSLLELDPVLARNAHFSDDLSDESYTDILALVHGTGMIFPVWGWTMRGCLPPGKGPTKPSFLSLRMTSLGLSGASLAMRACGSWS